MTDPTHTHMPVDANGVTTTQLQETLSPAVAALAAEPAGFRLEDELGRGGMGIVWRARDLALDRPVAVKLLQDHYAADSRTAARFLDEARITSQLQHPGIPAIYQAGRLPNGRPFLAMKLVKGCTLEEMIKSGEPLNVLAIFEGICQAVGYAHAHGILHRDLKPANVMVGAFGEVQVMDWGLAKSLASSEPTVAEEQSTATVIRSARDSDTQAGSLMGTPAFISPEQAAGETDKVNERSDVFGLGAILCAMLTGSPPFAGTGVESVRINAMRGHMPESQEKLASCGGDPDAVALCKQCLSFDAAARPANGGELAKQVAALRADAEERAKNAELDKARSEVDVLAQQKRRRVVMIAGGVIAAVLLAGIAGTGLGLLQANRAREAETARAEGERQARLEAQEQRAVAVAEAEAKELARKKEAEERGYAQAIADFVRNDFLAMTSVEGQTRFEGEGLSRTATLRDLLDRAAKRLKARKDLSPRTEGDLQWIIGVSYRAQGESAAAIPHLERAAKLRTEVWGENHSEALTAQNSLAVAYRSAGQYAKARALFEQTLARMTASLGPNHRDTLLCMNNIALVDISLGAPERAAPMFEKVRAAREATLGPVHMDTVETMTNLAWACRLLGRVEEAITLDGQALMVRKVHWGAEDHRTLASMHSLAHSYLAAGQTERAVKQFEQTLALRTKTLGSEHPDTLNTMTGLATSHLTAGQPNRALPLLELAAITQKARLGPEHPDTLMTQGSLARCLMMAQQMDRAVSLLEQTLAVEKRLQGPHHPQTLWLMGQLANGYLYAKQPDRALLLFKDVCELKRTHFGPDRAGTLDSINDMALAYTSVGEHAKALDLFEDTLRRRIATQGSDHPDTLLSIYNLGYALEEAGQFARALPHYEAAAAGLKKRKYQHGHAWRIVFNTVAALEGAGAYDRAEVLHRDWLAVMRKQSVAPLVEAGELAALAQNLLHQSKWIESEQLCRECLAIRKKLEPESWTTFNTESLLGEALASQMKHAEAEPLLRSGYDGIRKRMAALPSGSNRLREAGQRLVDFYTATGQPAKAEEWRAKLPREFAPLPRKMR